jgi:hypothetical protein
MYYAIGYVEKYNDKGELEKGSRGAWYTITGPHTSWRATSLALGKALVHSRGAAPWWSSAFTTMCLVSEDDLQLYGLHPAAVTYVQRKMETEGV